MVQQGKASKLTGYETNLRNIIKKLVLKYILPCFGKKGCRSYEIAWFFWLINLLDRESILESSFLSFFNILTVSSRSTTKITLIIYNVYRTRTIKTPLITMPLHFYDSTIVTIKCRKFKQKRLTYSLLQYHTQ